MEVITNVIQSDSLEERVRKFTLLFVQMINESERNRYSQMRLQAENQKI
ncbi:MAG: hypothetical protein J6C33_09330 [Lachnospiraceae bacterium]|nr:hypothetical protein [Lachnospiraceae bacterium]